MTEIKEWLECPGAVKQALPGKIEKAVAYAMDECFLQIVGTPEAQRDKWLYKEIKAQICSHMEEWVKEAIDDAIGKAIAK